MTMEPRSLAPRGNAAPSSDLALRFLQVSARLLPEYNVRSQSLERRIEQVARYLGVDLKTVVGYRQVTLVLADGRSLQARASELRINVAISAGAASLFAPPFAAGLIGAVLGGLAIRQARKGQVTNVSRPAPGRGPPPLSKDRG